VDRVFVAYTNYKSAILQEPIIEQLLPIVATGMSVGIDSGGPGKTHGFASDVFEPSPDTVLDQLLPRVIETRIYQALLESSASEHAARMMAMKSASDNASGMLDDLTFTYNQARQAGITREISEISAGKAALET
jgi:F-type H+-transporting ATPase subunit gamma